MVFTHTGRLGDFFATFPVYSKYYKDTGTPVTIVVPRNFPFIDVAKELCEKFEFIDKFVVSNFLIDNFDVGGQPYKFNPNEYGVNCERWYNLGFREHPEVSTGPIAEFCASEHGLSYDKEFKIELPFSEELHAKYKNKIGFADASAHRDDCNALLPIIEKSQIDFHKFDINLPIYENLLIAKHCKYVVSAGSALSVLLNFTDIPFSVFTWQTPPHLFYHQNTNIFFIKDDPFELIFKTPNEIKDKLNLGNFKMKVINVHPGILEIPPKTWGAIEKVIWNYHLELQKIGIESEISYLDNIQYNPYNIVHVHVTNLANIAHERGLQYFFSLHDHHALFEHGNDNYIAQTRNAIINSLKTIIHTPEFKTHPKFKDLADKFIYVQHGANPDIYKKIDTEKTGDLLCVASNGLLNYKFFDRKGFLLAKQVAETLNLKLTICCPSNTLDFLSKYDFINSPNIDIKLDLSEEELIKEYSKHKVFLHPSVLEAGHPNLTLTEAHLCGMKIVGSYKGELEIPGMIVANELVPNSYAAAILQALNSPDSIVPSKQFMWDNIVKKLVGIYKKHGYTVKSFTDSLLDSYSNRDSIIHGSDTSAKAKITFDMVPSVELKTFGEKTHNVKFASIDSSGNETVIYQTNLSNNMWSRPNNVYAKNWKVYLDNQLKYETDININRDMCAVVSSHPNTDGIIEKTKKTILNIKENIGLTTICASHIYPIKDRVAFIGEVSDYYVMNPLNTLTTHNYYRYYNGQHDGYTVFLDLWNSGNGMYHGPAVHQNYYNGVKRAKELGYKYAVLTNFDMLFSAEDNDKIKCVLNTVLVNNSNGFFLFTQDPEGPTYKTVFCVVNVDMFLDIFPEILSEADYSAFVARVGSESNGLENVYYHALKNTENLIIQESSESEFFNSENCFTNSQANYFAVLPLENDPAYDAAVFIKRVDNDSLGIPGFVCIKSSDYAEWEDGDIETVYHNFTTTQDFIKIIPFKFRRGKKYSFEFQLNIPDNTVYKNVVIDYFGTIQSNGFIKK